MHRSRLRTTLRRLPRFAPVCLALLLSLGPLCGKDTGASFLDRYQLAELKNGIRVIALSEPDSTLSVVQVWFRAGRADSPQIHPGAAELSSRVLFRSKLREVLARHHPDLFERGIRVESQCNQDTSFCSLEGPASALQASADTLARLLASPPRFSEAIVQVQRRLLVQEAQRQECSAPARFEKLIRQQVFTVHPYGRSVSSLMYDRDHLSPSILETFARTVFCPANLLVVIAGPQSGKDLTMVAARAFSAWTPLEEGRTTRLIEPKIVKSRSCHLAEDVEEARVALAFVAPAAKADEAVAGQLLARMLSPDGSPHLRKQVFGPWADSARIVASYAPHRDPSLFIIDVSAPDLDPSTVSGELLRRLKSLELTSFSLSEIAREKTQLVSRFLAEHQTLFERSRRLGRMACTHGPERLKSVLSSFLAQRGETLLAFLRETLRPEGCCVVSVGPTRLATPLDPEKRDAPQPMFPTGIPLPSGPFGRALHYPIGDGTDLAFRLTVLVPREDRHLAAPLSRSLRVFVENHLAERAIDGGWWLERPSQDEAATDLVEVQLNCEASVLPEILPHFLRHFGEAASQDSLPVDLRPDHGDGEGMPPTARRAVRRLLSTFFSSDPDGSSTLDDEKEPAPSGQVLAEAWKRAFHPSRSSLVVCGRCREGLLPELMKRTFPDPLGSSPRSHDSTDATALVTSPLPPHLPLLQRRPPDAPSPPAKSFRRIVDAAGPQGLVVVGCTVDGLDGADAIPALLLSEILGQGENSRLARSLRDGLGLGYASGSAYLPMENRGLLLAWIGVHPERLAVAEQALVEEFLRPAREPVSPSELVQARATLRTRWLADMQSSLHAAPLLGRLLARAGLDSPAPFLARSRSLTTKDLLEAARRCMDHHAVYIERPVTTARPSNALMLPGRGLR